MSESVLSSSGGGKCGRQRRFASECPARNYLKRDRVDMAVHGECPSSNSLKVNCGITSTVLSRVVETCT